MDLNRQWERWAEGDAGQTTTTNWCGEEDPQAPRNWEKLNPNEHFQLTHSSHTPNTEAQKDMEKGTDCRAPGQEWCSFSSILYWFDITEVDTLKKNWKHAKPLSTPSIIKFSAANHYN